MHPDFSEFSYGYAVTEELATKFQGRIVAAPQFPSLYQEGKKGGYDVKIPVAGFPVFLQFKLSDYLERKSAKEHKNKTLSVPYYRMHLRPARHSDQHRLLLDLERAGETVFYIAPEFHLPTELNQNYLNKKVLANSAAFSPRKIGPLPTRDHHYVVFRKGDNHGYRCSEEPEWTEKISFAEGLLPVLKQRQIVERELGESGLAQLANHMLHVLELRDELTTESYPTRDIPGIRQIVSERPIVESIGYMSRTFFGTELVVIPSA